MARKSVDRTAATYEEPNWLSIDPTVEAAFRDKGFRLRWIRVIGEGGNEDRKNIFERQSDGFKFVPVDDPDARPLIEKFGQTDLSSARIQVGDVALGMIPIERHQARADFYHNKTASLKKAIDSQLQKHNDPRMPIQDRSRSTSDSGRVPRFDD